MIISMDDYRRIDTEDDSGAATDRRRIYDIYGNTAPKLRLATLESELHGSPNLPANFRDFDAKEFIDRAYSLATQI